MTRRANKFFAKKIAGGLGPEQPALRVTAGSPDGYHSVKETSDFDDNTEEEAQEVESDVEHMIESDNSDDSSVQSDHASLHSQCSTTENRDWKRVKRRLKAMHSDRATNARRGSRAELQTGRSPRWCCPCSEIQRRKGCWSMLTGQPK